MDVQHIYTTYGHTWQYKVFHPPHFRGLASLAHQSPIRSYQLLQLHYQSNFKGNPYLGIFT